MTRLGLKLLALCFALSLLSRAQAAEQPAGPPVTQASKEEARQRFDRGLSLYNSGDNMGALAEFERAYELTRHPIVLYNVALVYANLGQAAKAVEALEKLKDRGFADLGPERAARAQQVYQDVLQRVGLLEIKTNVERATVQIDNVDVAQTPTAPLRVTAGSHLVSVLSTGYEPRRMSVSVAGQARQELNVALVPLEQAVAHLTITTDVPDVEVLAGAQSLGKTPFASQVAFKPGVYDLVFRRPGYVTLRRRVTAYAGSQGQLHVTMTASDAGLLQGAKLFVKVSEPNAVVSVDGKPRLDHARGLPLPIGRHQLKVERAGFFDLKRELIVQPGTNELDVALLPTADYLGDYVARARAQRTWSYIALGAGALTAGAGGVYLIWNQGQKNDAEESFDQLATEIESSPSGTCQGSQCDRLELLLDDLDSKRGRDLYGWLAVGIGGAAVGTGVLLYALGDDPSRYEPNPESDVFGSLGLDLLRVYVGLQSLSVTASF